MPVTWLHLSDLHLVPSNSSETFIHERTSNLDNLCSFVRENVARGEWKPYLIFVTGDIANRGNEAVFTANGGEPAPASLFFNKLLDAAGLERDRLFIVPGNHEVNRNRMRGTGLTPTFEKPEELEEHFSLDEPCQYITRKLGAFAAWYNDYFKGIRTFTDRSTCMAEQVEIDGLRISLLLMNSAVFCADSTTDSAKLLIGKGCLDSCLQPQGASEKNDLSIGLIHHPLSFLAPFDQTTIRALLKEHLDLLLRGHTHEPEVHEGEFLEVASGAAGEQYPWPRSAMYGRFEERKVTLYPLCNSGRPNWQWTLDTSVFPKDHASGHCRTIPLDRYGAALSVVPASEEEWERYRTCLKRELGTLRLFGLPSGFERIDVNLDDDTFVKLSINWKHDFRRGYVEEFQGTPPDRDTEPKPLKPAQLMVRAFSGNERRLLLILGDAGTGKTTLMQYYALSVLEEQRAGSFGFSLPVRVFFLHLRSLRQKEGAYESLPESLHRWASNHGCQVDPQVFESWLQSGESLVLLDGLDEITGTIERQEACNWIDKQWRNEAYEKARFVVTTRRTGFRDVELQALTHKAYVQDFDSGQQGEFLQKWFSALKRSELEQGERFDRELQRHIQEQSEAFAKKIIGHLADDRYKGLRPLAAIPMVLQMMALLWYREHDLPKTREQLYRGLFDYLVLKRETAREILEKECPLAKMGVERFRTVLGALALWMFSDTKRGGEQVRSADMLDLFTRELNTMASVDFTPPSSKALTDHLVNRAELLTANFSNTIYEFRHKSFREYLAGAKLGAVSLRNPECFDPVIAHFDDPSWEEAIRFFVAGLDLFQFDHFMSRLFDPLVKPSFSQPEKLLLQLLIGEAPNRKTDALQALLCTPKEVGKGYDAERQRRQFMMLDALALIGELNSAQSVREFIDKGYAECDDEKSKKREKVESYARTVFVSLGGQMPEDGKTSQPDDKHKTHIVQENGKTLFRNRLELNAEYILISRRAREEQRIFFARYPVTNKLYRRFIDFLRSKPPEYQWLEAELQTIADEKRWDTRFAEYLKKGKSDFATLFSSMHDEDRKFGGDDQPVVSITWYAARSYCLWLSLMESEGERTDLYRLPNEPEWEWAASGKEKRHYPWGNTEPNPKLANYGENVGATTPVGSYPDGATPEGLYDMAGNVWEWMENWYDDNTKRSKALRGGSWSYYSEFLACSSRLNGNPDYWFFSYGFRVVRPSPLA